MVTESLYRHFKFKSDTSLVSLKLMVRQQTFLDVEKKVLQGKSDVWKKNC